MEPHKTENKLLKPQEPEDVRRTREAVLLERGAEGMRENVQSPLTLFRYIVNKLAALVHDNANEDIPALNDNVNEDVVLLHDNADRCSLLLHDNADRCVVLFSCMTMQTDVLFSSLA